MLRLILIFILFNSGIAKAQIFNPNKPRKTAYLALGIEQDTKALKPKQRIQTLSYNTGLMLYRSEKSNVYVNLKSDVLDTGIKPILLKSSSTYIKSHLVKTDFTLNYETLDQLGLSLSYGSASDSTFSNARQNTLSLNLYKAIKKNWYLLANYSNNRSFLNNIPLPTIGYQYKSAKTFSTFIAPPILIFNWIKFPTYMHQIFISPSNLKMSFSWGVLGPIRIYTHYKYSLKTFMHKNRKDKDDRLFFKSQNLGFGIKGPINRSLSLDLGLNFAYDREIFEAESAFKSKRDKIKIDKGLAFISSIKYQF